MAIPRLIPDEQYADNAEAASRYMVALHGGQGAGALEYLRGRGLTDDVISEFGLGFVAEPFDGHEKVAGRIAIPYFNNRGVTAIRFRAMPDMETKAKYLDMPGAHAPLYNITALNKGGSVVHICEGEIDTIVANMIGLNAIGLSGVNKWEKSFRSLLAGFHTIRVLCDGDEPGIEMGERIKDELRDAYVQIKVAPDGMDVNSAYQELGREALLAYWGIEDEMEVAA